MTLHETECLQEIHLPRPPSLKFIIHANVSVHSVVVTGSNVRIVCLVVQVRFLCMKRLRHSLGRLMMLDLGTGFSDEEIPNPGMQLECSKECRAGIRAAVNM